MKILNNDTSDLFTLEDNLFGDITFESFEGKNIKKFGSNAFNKTTDKINLFSCSDCQLETEPNYDLNQVFNRMTKLQQLHLGLKTTEIPSIKPIGNQTSLSVIDINANQLVIKSGVLQHLKNLLFVNFDDVTINRIDKEAFKIDNHNSFLNINFFGCKLTNGTFQNGSFDGIQKQALISFNSMDIKYIPEESFKSVLSNNKSKILFSFDDATIDCDNCKNLWLINEKKDKQLQNPHCKNDTKKMLFDSDIKTKLSQKCK